MFKMFFILISISFHNRILWGLYVFYLISFIEIPFFQKKKMRCELSKKLIFSVGSLHVYLHSQVIQLLSTSKTKEL